MIILMSRTIHGKISSMVLQTLDEGGYVATRKWLQAEIPQKLSWEVYFWTNDVDRFGFDGWGSMMLSREQILRQPGSVSAIRQDFQEKADEIRTKLRTTLQGIQAQLNETAPGVVLPSLEQPTEATVTKTDN